MRMIRRQLVALVVAVLASQAAGVATPLAFFQSPADGSAPSEELACTCPDGGMGKECPMHKHQAPAPSRDTPRCVSCHDNGDVALTTVSGVTGLVIERQQADVPDGVSSRVIASSTQPLTLVRPPVAPPPRS